MSGKAFVLDGPLEGQIFDLPDSGVIAYEETWTFDPEEGGPLRETSRPEQRVYVLERIAMQPNLVLTVLSTKPLPDLDVAAAWRAILRPEIVAILEER
jgi:hypothetical protein